MTSRFNKTEADIVYERYKTIGEGEEPSAMPVNDWRPVGTVSAQSDSEEGDGSTPVETPYTRHETVGTRPVDWDGVVGDGADPELEADSRLAADIGLNEPDVVDADPVDAGLIKGPADERDDLVASDAAYAMGAAGLTDGLIDYADEEAVPAAEDVDMLPDVPDVDEITPGAPVDPAAPPTDAVHGTDLINGSTGEEE